jgi:hypothetical protein
VKTHTVTFYSPGTFLLETSTLEIQEWDVDQALRLAFSVVERHGARPFSFRFNTEGDGKPVVSSPLYYIGGRIRTLADVEADNLPNEEVLRWNMKNNGIARVIETNTSYKHTSELKDDDIVLDERYLTAFRLAN